MNTFGQAGAGIFPGPIAIDKEIRSQYRVVTMKRLESVTERFYAISIERRLKHAAVVTISETARVALFGDR